MKKLLYTFSLMFVMVFASIMLSACGKGDPKSISVKENTMPTTVLINEELDTSKLVLLVKYENGSIEEVARNDKMEISNLDTSTIGIKDLTIKYLNLETQIKIKVVNEEQTYTISGFEMPGFYNQYKNSLNSSGNTENDFLVRTNTYKVGDDNGFVFLPKITAIDPINQEYKTIYSYESKAKVEMMDGEYRELSNEELANYVAVDNLNSSFDFTERAIKEKFRITVEPADNSFGVDPLTFECEVVDGWNIYNAAGFSRLSNSAESQADWAEYKTKNNIGNEKISSLVFHDNIIITKDDIPKANLYTENDAEVKADPSLKDTLRDRLSIYRIDVPYGEQFNVYGNYFSLDYSKIPFIKESALNATTSHAALIDIGGDNWNSIPSTKRQGDFIVDSLKIFGNASRTENEQAKGGLIAFLTSAQKFEVNNTIARKTFTFAITANFNNPENNSANYYNNSKFYDSFSTLFFAWDSKINVFNKCVLKGSGGPIFMATHVEPKPGNETTYSNAEFNDCELSALVMGQEGWFQINGAQEVATQIKAMNEPILKIARQLKDLGKITSAKGFIKIEDGKELINLIAAITADDPLLNQNQLGGSLVIKNNGQVVSNLNMRNEKIEKIWEINGATKAMPFFESNNVLLATDKENLFYASETKGLINVMEMFAAPQNYGAEIQEVIKFFEGDYFNLYQPNNTIGVTVEFFDVA